MEATRRSLKKHTEEKLEELMGMIDETNEKEDFGIRE